MRYPVLSPAVALMVLASSGATAADYIVTQEIRAIGAAFLANANEGSRNTRAQALALYSLDADIFLSERLAVDAAFYVRGALPGSFVGGVLAPNQDTSRAPYFDVIELGVKWQEENYSLKLGKFLQSYEFANYSSVLNRYNLTDRANPLQPVKMGNWLAQGNLLFDEGTLSLTVMPFHPKLGQPDSGSRWGGIDANGNLLGEGGDSQDDASSGMPDVTLIWQGTTSDFDYLVGMGVGQSLYTVAPADLLGKEIASEQPDNTNLFAGIAYPVDGARLYGEVYYQDTWYGRDDEFIRAVAGVSVDLFEVGDSLDFSDLELIVEGSLDRTLDGQNAPHYIGASSASRPLQNALYMSVNAGLSDTWSASQSIVWGTTKAELASTTRVTWSASDSTSISGQVLLFDGRDNASVFGEWQRNDLVSIEVSHKF